MWPENNKREAAAFEAIRLTQSLALIKDTCLLFGCCVRLQAHKHGMDGTPYTKELTAMAVTKHYTLWS